MLLVLVVGFYTTRNQLSIRCLVPDKYYVFKDQEFDCRTYTGGGFRRLAGRQETLRNVY